MPASDVEIVGTFAINTYKVTYLVDGDEYETSTLTYGSAIELIAEPTKEGYTFSGWSEAPSTMPASDVEIVGTFTINTYKVTYLVDGEEFATDSITYSNEIVLREQPTKEGYTFSGWSEAPSTMPASDVEITGIFVINIYSVVVSSTEGGVATASASEAEYNSSVTLTATPDDNYEFVNWTLNGEEISTELTISVIVTADVEFVANFKEIESSIKEESINNAIVYSINNAIIIKDYIGIARVVNLAGQIIKEVNVVDYLQIDINSGVYFVVTNDNVTKVLVK